MKSMVDRFLAWPLPDSVCSDTCVTERDYGKAQGWPKRSGTNLLTADEARLMLEFVAAPHLAALQAKIDSLMLEYCPEEMTPEQMANWAAHQKPAGPEAEAALDRASRPPIATKCSYCDESHATDIICQQMFSAHGMPFVRLNQPNPTAPRSSAREQ